MRPRILLADEHWMMMHGVRCLLQSRAEVVGMYDNGQELVDFGARIHPDIIILEVALPVVNGFEAARRLRQSTPQTKLIYLTQQSGTESLLAAQQLGAAGYILKKSAFSELVSALDAAVQGRTYTTPLLKMQPGVVQERNGSSDGLTARELDVLRLAADGRRAKEVADELRISVKTVQFHRANLSQKLGLRTTAELVKYAVRRGFVAP